MGYRSDVFLRVTDDTKKVFEAARKICKHFDGLLTDSEFECGKDSNNFIWNHTKWYDNYPEIESFNNVISQISEEEYGMIRLGEETNDIEYYGSPCDFGMYVSRTVEW